MKFIVIGISDNPQPWFPPEVLEIIKQGKVFSGGKRHHEIVASLLPSDAQWIDITVPLDAVFEQYHSSPVIVFASGDPLFFGFANTIQRKLPDAEIELFYFILLFNFSSSSPFPSIKIFHQNFPFLCNI